MNNFPELCCKTTGNKTKQWHIQVKPDKSSTNKAIIMITYGFEGCKQRTITKVFENINIHTPSKDYKSTLQLAYESAQKEHNIKLLNGYVISSKQQQQQPNTTRYSLRTKASTTTTSLNEDDDDDTPSTSTSTFNPVKYKKYPPMLAYDYNKRSEYIKFPCHVQPKLDGVRAVAHNNKLYSRNWNIFPELPHIITELSLIKENIILDGEMYTDDINFESIVGLVRKGHKSDEELANSYKLYYNVFDCIDTSLPFTKRYALLQSLFTKYTFKHIRLVKTETCQSKANVDTYLTKYINEGYEGLILRNSSAKYEINIRSNNLQKLKRFIDDEFDIIGYTTPTDGKEIGCVIWKCKTKAGNEFTVRPEGNYEYRKKLYRNAKKYIGKKLTVKFQAYTKGGVPRFPVGISIRDYE